MKLFKASRIFACLFSLILTFAGCSNQKTTISIYSNSEDLKIQFAIDEISSVLVNNGITVTPGENENSDIIFTVQSGVAMLKPEGFSIKPEGGHIIITGADAAGAMYGGLELAEQLKLFGFEEVKETQQNSYMERRGTKFNIPLDVRTPSYTDVSDAAQNNIAEMWSTEFWKEYIDNLARYRFNTISLWSLHPFPSMVKVAEYPDVALNDVQRSTVDWKEDYDLEGTGFDAPEIVNYVEVIKVMTIDEKIEFWRSIMKYAKDRNIAFYVVTWNIFVNGTEGKYGITDDINNKITRDYFRKSVKQMFVTYPDLAGIGLTTGENMQESTVEAKEDWAYETYGMGVLDAAAEMPDRKFTLIHRQHMAGARKIAEKFKPLLDNENIEFLFSFKYAQAHVFSSTTQAFHEDYVKDIEGMKTLWTLRNDDNYYFRWGAPDFVREFIHNIPMDVTRGFYYGSDQWVWGREFLTKEAETPRQIEIVKHWYHWMMWGRLGYDPEISNERFTQILQNHFPEIDAEKLFTSWQAASMIYPTTTGFHWGSLDFQWYIEACKSRPSFAQNETGFHDVNRFISLPPHPKSGFQSIPDFVKMTVTGESTELVNPLQVAQKLHSLSDQALGIVETLNAGNNKELEATLNDIHTMAYLGKYYAHKIDGSTNLALYRQMKDKKYQDEAVNQLTMALKSWEDYIQKAMQQNTNPLWTNRVGHVDWVKTTEWVRQDIEIAKVSLE